MPVVEFSTPSSSEPYVVSGPESTRLLALAIKEKVPIQFGCSACRCGTCAVELVSGELSEMKALEKELLKRMLILDGTKIRLACQARLTRKKTQINLGFQNTYDSTLRK